MPCHDNFAYMKYFFLVWEISCQLCGYWNNNSLERSFPDWKLEKETTFLVIMKSKHQSLCNISFLVVRKENIFLFLTQYLICKKNKTFLQHTKELPDNIQISHLIQFSINSWSVELFTPETPRHTARTAERFEPDFKRASSMTCSNTFRAADSVEYHNS